MTMYQDGGRRFGYLFAAGVPAIAAGAGSQLLYRKQEPSHGLPAMRDVHGVPTNAALTTSSIIAGAVTGINVVAGTGPENIGRSALMGVRGGAWSSLGWLLSERFLRRSIF